MDSGAWWATVHEVAKSRTRLSDLTFTSQLSIYGSEQKLWKYMLEMDKIQMLNKEPTYKLSTKKVIISQWLKLKTL